MLSFIDPAAGLRLYSAGAKVVKHYLSLFTSLYRLARLLIQGCWRDCAFLIKHLCSSHRPPSWHLGWNWNATLSADQIKYDTVAFTQTESLYDWTHAGIKHKSHHLLIWLWKVYYYSDMTDGFSPERTSPHSQWCDVMWGIKTNPSTAPQWNWWHWTMHYNDKIKVTVLHLTATKLMLEAGNSFHTCLLTENVTISMIPVCFLFCLCRASNVQISEKITSVLKRQCKGGAHDFLLSVNSEAETDLKNISTEFFLQKYLPSLKLCP